VPQTILLGTGENSNRATSFTQQQNFFLYIAGVQQLISETLSNALFTKVLSIDSCPVYMSFNSLQTKTDLELAEEREIYLKNGVLTPDEVRQEMGLEPISTPPENDHPITDDSGAFIFSPRLDDPELIIEAEEDFVFNSEEKMEFGGILQNLSDPIKSRFIQDQQILSHKIDKIMDKYKKKIVDEIDSNLASEEQELAGEDILIDSELLAPERDALIASIFLDSKKKFKQGIALGEDFIKKQYPQVAGIKVKSTVNEGAIKALDLRSTQLAKTVHGDLLTATQATIREGLQARKGAKQLKEDIEKVFEKFGGTSGRFQKLGTRAELIARTELHRSFVDGTLQSFRELKVSKVAMVVNTGACEECIELSADNQDTPLHLSQGIIPVHPRCRCGWVANSIIDS